MNPIKIIFKTHYGRCKLHGIVELGPLCHTTLSKKRHDCDTFSPQFVILLKKFPVKMIFHGHARSVFPATYMLPICKLIWTLFFEHFPYCKNMLIQNSLFCRNLVKNFPNTGVRWKNILKNSCMLSWVQRRSFSSLFLDARTSFVCIFFCCFFSFREIGKWHKVWIVYLKYPPASKVFPFFCVFLIP